MAEARVHTDICARCGCDRKEQRRDGFGCRSWGRHYDRHMWGWDDPEHGQPGHDCGSCVPPPAAGQQGAGKP